MDKKNSTSAITDNILRILAVSGVAATALVAPNLLIALDKPLRKYLGRLDERARQRELSRVINYMRSQGLIKDDYRHGLRITAKGRRRMQRVNFAKLRVPKPEQWDQRWRLVFFDIPEERKTGRDALIRKLKQLDFYQLQRSVWVHPFPCRPIIEKVADAYQVDKFVTYVETTYIDNQAELAKIFHTILSS
ncbi:MAG TPA: hypothetical protein VEH48_02265 [Candidatus Nitrosopolaris sp.]|nr:hypothetical protein [Candidatus Nitrosopolaris sp.]